jgi:uncharacterized protein involved in exopolysaccharide biosynthesis
LLTEVEIKTVSKYVPGWHTQGGLSITDLVHALVVKWRYVAAGGVIGVVFAIGVVAVRPAQYTASTDLILLNRQDQLQLPDIPGLSGLLPQIGGDLLQGPSNIKDAAYAYILMSPAVRLRVARDTFSVEEASRPMTLVEYVNQKKAREGEPYVARGKAPQLSGSGMQVSAAERRALQYLDDHLKAFSKPNPRTITLEVTTASPDLSVSIAERMVFHFRVHLQELRRQKFGQKASYLRVQLKDARNQLRKAEDRLSRFESRNQGQKTARLETERDRLERDVQMAERKYRYLLERRREVEKKIENNRAPFETLDRPTVPSNKSNHPVPLVAAVCSLLGVFAGMSVAFAQVAFANGHTQ